MNVFNYNADDKDWTKIKEILKCLQEETKEFFCKYLSNFESLKGIDPSEAKIIYNVLQDTSEYGEFTRKYFSRLKSSISYDNKISYQVVKRVLPVFANISKSNLKALSPLNLCLLLDYNFIYSIDDVLLYDRDTVIQSFKELAKIEEKDYLKKLGNILTQGKKMEVQSFFKTCASILDYIKSIEAGSKFTDKEKYDLSIILGMFYYNDSNKDYNIKNEFLNLFKDVLSKERILEYIGINSNSFDFSSYYNPLMLSTFSEDMSENDIYKTLRKVFGQKGDNSLIGDLCNYLNIDDDEVYDRLKLLYNSKKESISSEEIEKKYLELFTNQKIETVKLYNTASWVYNYLDKFKNSEYRNNTNKRVVLSLLISCFLNSSEELVYLESEGITLKELLNVTIHNTELLNDKFDFDKCVDEKVLVNKFGSNYIYPFNEVIKKLVNSNDKDVELIFIKLGKDINRVKSNINNKKIEKPKLSYQEEIELINRDKPLLDVESYSSISSFGNTIMSGVNSAINEVLQIMNGDVTSKKLNDIKGGVSSVYEEREIIVSQKKSGFFTRLLSDEVEEKSNTEIVIHFDYIRELEDRISEYTSDIDKQIFVYDWIQKRNIAYASKLKEYIEVAKNEKEKLLKNKISLDKNDPSSLFKMQYYKTQIDLLESKIASLQTSYMTMLQHFMAVDNAIRAHSVSSDALRKVINDFMPLLSSSMLISSGLEKDKEAKLIVKKVIDLTNNYLSNNVESAREILDSLKTVGLPEERMLRIQSDLELQDREENKKDDNEIKLTL